MAEEFDNELQNFLKIFVLITQKLANENYSACQPPRISAQKFYKLFHFIFKHFVRFC